MDKPGKHDDMNKRILAYISAIKDLEASVKDHMKKRESCFNDFDNEVPIAVQMEREHRGGNDGSPKKRKRMSSITSRTEDE